MKNILKKINFSLSFILPLFIFLLLSNTSSRAQIYSVSFDGIDDYIDMGIPAGQQPTTALTVEAWIYPKSNSIYEGIVSNIYWTLSTTSGYGLFMFGQNSGNELVSFFLSTTSNYGQINGTVQLNQWNHVAGTYSGGVMNLYVNGIFVGNGLISGTIDYDPSNNLNVGRYHDNDETYWYDGYIDEVRIWNTARSQTEIASNMFTELSGNESGLVGYWNFNEGAGTTAFDATAGHYDGTLYNGVGWYEGSGLPVELKSFNASRINNKVLLNWKTETEMNNYGFEIYRNTGDDNWQMIGFVKGHGNSNSPKEYQFEDNLIDAELLRYKLKQIDFNGAFKFSNVVEVENILLNEFSLNQNYPNPFNPSTSITFKLAKKSYVKIKIFNSLGQLVSTLIDKSLDKGSHEVKWIPRNLPTGIYIYSLEAYDSDNSNLFRQTKKMSYIK